MWNKNLTKETDSRVMKSSKKLSFTLIKAIYLKITNVKTQMSNEISNPNFKNNFWYLVIWH